MVMKTEKSHSLPSASYRARKSGIIIQFEAVGLGAVGMSPRVPGPKN